MELTSLLKVIIPHNGIISDFISPYSGERSDKLRLLPLNNVKGVIGLIFTKKINFKG